MLVLQARDFFTCLGWSQSLSSGFQSVLEPLCHVSVSNMTSLLKHRSECDKLGGGGG